MEGSLDDIQAELSNGTRRLLQVKFGTDPGKQWEWEDFIRQEMGRRGNPKPSLLQKWKTSLASVFSQGLEVSEAALLTNRDAGETVRSVLSQACLVDFALLPAPLKAEISVQLGGDDEASSFFSSFRFRFREPSLETLEESLLHRFQRLMGSRDGFGNLIRMIRRWINHQDEPSRDGKIILADVRRAALYHHPPLIPQGFLIPDDYVVPGDWSQTVVEPLIKTGGEQLVVITGSPGAGKSTYLSWLTGHLRQYGIPSVRHHFFLSTTDATQRRTDWETAADAIIGQLRSDQDVSLGHAESVNPTSDTLRKHLIAAGSARAGKEPLLVIIDGLDHVWRDTGSDEGLRRLFDLLLPVPDGVVVVVGTQEIDPSRIPLKLRQLCPQEKWLRVPALDFGGIQEWLKHHKEELEFPEDDGHAARVYDEFAGAFLSASGGHPLILHYCFNAAKQISPSIHPDRVRALPVFDPTSSVANYYAALWDGISAEGHQLLHLLAGFPWAWPAEGLLQCAAPHENYALLESAERNIRHVLGKSTAGITAFHESLLAFIRARPEHGSTVNALRHKVLTWLSGPAPEYWRWRYEWGEQAKNGEPGPLISSPTLEWCIDSLAKGRSRTEIAEVVAESGWVALKSELLGVATERCYQDRYLAEAGTADSTLSKLVWLGLRNRDPRSRELEVELFLDRVAWAEEEEIKAVAEVSFSSGRIEVCRELLNECFERWDKTLQRQNNLGGTFTSLELTIPTMIAASFNNLAQGPYRRYLATEGRSPEWCRTDRYVAAMAKLCAIGDDTKAIREELRFLANNDGQISFEAVYEIVLIACREGFNPSVWIQSSEAKRLGYLRCYNIWHNKTSEPLVDPPLNMTFEPVWSENHFSTNDDSFVRLVRNYFFYCLASVAEGRQVDSPHGLNPKATKVASFLAMLRKIAEEASATLAAGRTVSGQWFISRIAQEKRPKHDGYDWDNDVLLSSMGRLIALLTQDIEELHFSATHTTSLSPTVIAQATESQWTGSRAWVVDRVNRRRKVRDPQTAEFLIDCEKNSLERSKDTLHSRAEAYATLACFCRLNERPTSEVEEFARRAARNLLGYGYRKDPMLYDILHVIRNLPEPDKVLTLEQLQSISPVIQIISDITDGSGTRDFEIELAKAVWEIVPNSFPSFIRTLQYDHKHWAVESCFTYLAESIQLGTPFENALATTMVHEEALLSLQGRGLRGDEDANIALSETMNYCGRHELVRAEPETTATNHTGTLAEKATISAQDYRPEQLNELIRALREAQIYDEQILASWTRYWIENDPDNLLAAITNHILATGRPHENITAREVVSLAQQRLGNSEAWRLLVAFHKASYGWDSYYYETSKLEWMWEFVRTRFQDRWIEFIAETARPQWHSAGGAPRWGIKRMVQFLLLLGKRDQVTEVINAAVRWGAASAADMVLPHHALIPDEPDFPVALRLLADRLDCPSRMVQERAAWSLASLLGEADTHELTKRALIDWHREDPSQLRSCTLLTILLLAVIKNTVSPADCVEVARLANILPSIGTDLLLREFGEYGGEFADGLSFRKQHFSSPGRDFRPVQDFDKIVSGHLTPMFCHWAEILDKSGIPFTRQWQWESSELAKSKGLSLGLQDHYDYHFRGGPGRPSLAISDRLAVMLRSAYLRAIHWALDSACLSDNSALIHARHAAIMANPTSWAVRHSERPPWWPSCTIKDDVLDTLGEAVGQALKRRIEERDPNEQEVLLYAAGPVGFSPNFCADFTIKAFFQSALGSLVPTKEQLSEINGVSCFPIPPRLSLSGNYMCFNDRDYAERINDWGMAPLSWNLLTDAPDWWLPDRAQRGIHVPPTWLFRGAPIIKADQDMISINLGRRTVANYRYWADEVHERRYYGTSPRVGGQLLVQRECLEPHIANGATLCWVATLMVAQRGEYKDNFEQPHIAGTWVIGGSRLARRTPWSPW
jgi:hypothetical protein